MIFVVARCRSKPFGLVIRIAPTTEDLNRLSGELICSPALASCNKSYDVSLSWTLVAKRCTSHRRLIGLASFGSLSILIKKILIKMIECETRRAISP